MRLIINKIIYRNLYKIDLDVQFNFLEQLTKFEYDQRNKNLIYIFSFINLVTSPAPVVITTYYTINANLKLNQQIHVYFLLIYILFILNFLNSIAFFTVFCLIPNFLPLKIRISKMIETKKIYFIDGLLSLNLLILCGILILKILIGRCSNNVLVCNPLDNSDGIPIFIIVILCPIVYPLIFGGMQFITVLLNWFFTLITLILASSLLKWNAQNVFIIMIYILLSPICIFQIHMLQLRQFVFYMNLRYKTITNNISYEDLERLKTIEKEPQEYDYSSVIQNHSLFGNRKLHTCIKEEISLATTPSIDSIAISYPTIESIRSLNDFSVFYEYYEQEYSIVLFEIKSGKISDSYSIWKLFPQLALIKHNTDPDKEVHGLKSLQEAMHFLLDLKLGPKLIILLTSINEKNNEGIMIERLLGTNENAMILLSCTTLFFYSSFGTSYNRLFEILMWKCREELNESDSETQLFCSESVNCYR